MSRTRHWFMLASALAAAPSCIRYEEAPQKRSATKRAGEKKQRKHKNERSARREPLESLGYVDGTLDPHIERTGVIVHDRQRTFPGYNFYTSRKQYRAQLVDMQGTVVHVWEVGGTGSWQHATLLDNGDVLVLVKDKQILRIDKDSNVLWTLQIRAHHDLWVTRDDEIHVLARRRIDAPYHPTLRTVEDYVAVVSPDGELLRSVSVLDAIERSPYAFMLARAQALPAAKLTRPNPRPDEEFDILHTNHVEIMDGRFADRSPIFARGNILLSPRNLGAVLVIDPTSGEIVWIWGSNNLMYQHHPTVTPDGTIMIFNNGMKRTGSQIVEVDPLTNTIVWTYGPVKGFYSVQRGSNQRLPNGNTLITESDTGYVFEVTRAGDVVWKFVNPHIKRRTKTRMAIWRMTRHAADALKFELNRRR